MLFTLDEQKEFSKIKKETEEALATNSKLQQLYKRKQQIINFLTLMNPLEENKRLLDEYNKLDITLKQIEECIAFKISKEEKDIVVKKRLWWGKEKKYKSEEKYMEKYMEKFNERLKETNYSKIIKDRNKIFKNLERINSKNSYLLYDLDSVETEISIIETDEIRNYVLKYKFIN